MSNMNPHWLKPNRLDLATAASVVVSTLVALIGNYLVDKWTWASAVAFIMLAVLTVILEVVRQRYGHTAGRATRGGITNNVNVQTAGRDAILNTGNTYNIRFGSAIAFIIAIILAILLFTYGPKGPNHVSGFARNTPVATPEKSIAPLKPPFTGHGIINDSDLDPTRATNKLADASFDSIDNAGLSMLNGAGLAKVEAPLSKATCSGIPTSKYFTSIKRSNLHNGLTFCLRTSDGHWGSISVSSVRSDPLGGSLYIVWTVWY